MDVAQLGLKVDTSDVERGVQQLKKISPSAKVAEQAAKSMSNSMSQSSVIFAKATEIMVKGMLGLAQANGNASKSALDNLRNVAKQASELVKAAEAQKVLASSVERTTTAITKQSVAMKAAASNATLFNNASSAGGRVKPDAKGVHFTGMAVGGGFGGPSPTRDLAPNRFNTTNIAAQFQDVGVTAAMGMSPLTIALQQGTQLSAILNSMENPLKGIAAAFRQLINPVALLSITFVGLVAVGIQFVDWIEVAKWGLNTLADAVQMVEPYALQLGLSLALVFGPSLVSSLAAATVAVVSFGAAAVSTAVRVAAAWVLANPVTAFVGAFLLILNTAYIFRDDLAKLLGVDIFDAAKKGVNLIIGAFVGAFNGIMGVWNLLPSAIGDIVVQAANNTMKSLVRLINDYIWLINDKLGTEIKPAIFTPFKNEFAGSAKEVGSILTDEMNKALGNVDYVGAMTKPLTFAISGAADKISQTLRGFSNDLGKTGADKTGKEKKDPWAEIVKDAEKRIEALKAERSAIGMLSQESDFLKIKTDLLNQAREKDIVLTTEQTSKLVEYARQMAAIQEESRRTKEALDLVRSASEGFFSDMRSGLQEGKTLWESFANSISNILDKLIDKFMSVSFDMAFSGSGSSSFIDSVSRWLFGGMGDVKPHAKGGIVDSPTMFAFAKGGALGLMGEAGPEAILPLHRGPDGSLGVKNSGGGGGQLVTVNVINNNSGAQARKEQRQTSNGVEIDVIIDEIVASKIGSQGTSSDRALQERSSRQLIRR